VQLAKRSFFLRIIFLEDVDKEKLKADILAALKALGELAGTLGTSDHNEILDRLRAEKFKGKIDHIGTVFFVGTKRAAGSMSRLIRSLLVLFAGGIVGLWLTQRGAAHDAIVEVPLRLMDHAFAAIQAWFH